MARDKLGNLPTWGRSGVMIGISHVYLLCKQVPEQALEYNV
ncbi:predicted protein [Botrytis cinerea T4]|uniref:Uncharacterized protein n=1 Tax=Botryotinia fuckeliana (strain T4) TaxID=999810 RepID=G2XSY5_BOTF4|nr:predicted protein [Botrytis cinerea T4]